MPTYTDRSPTDPTYVDREDDALPIEGAEPDDDDVGLPSARMGEPQTEHSDRSNPATTWTDR